jgi:hypothetical protein
VPSSFTPGTAPGGRVTVFISSVRPDTSDDVISTLGPNIRAKTLECYSYTSNDRPPSKNIFARPHPIPTMGFTLCFFLLLGSISIFSYLQGHSALLFHPGRIQCGMHATADRRRAL